MAMWVWTYNHRRRLTDDLHRCRLLDPIRVHPWISVSIRVPLNPVHPRPVDADTICGPVRAMGPAIEKDTDEHGCRFAAHGWTRIWINPVRPRPVEADPVCGPVRTWEPATESNTDEHGCRLRRRTDGHGQEFRSCVLNSIHGWIR